MIEEWTFRAGNLFEVMSRIQTIYRLKLPHSMMSTSVQTSPSSMRDTTVILETGSGYDIICVPPLPLGWELHVCLFKKIFTRGKSNGKLYRFRLRLARAQDLDALTTRIFSVANYFSVEVITGNRFTSCKVNSVCCTDRQVYFIKKRTSLLGCVLDELTVDGFESMKMNTADLLPTHQKKGGLLLLQMRHKVALCRQDTLAPYSLVRVRGGYQSVWLNLY